jgi:hypothetical protein
MRVAGLMEKLDRYLPLLEVALDGATLAPDLLGASGPRTYLVLALNNQELRAVGGFISGVGELRVEHGELVSQQFSDSYSVDNLNVPHETTPLDFRQTLSGELWFFRDTNWDADFPTSAQRALDVYARDRGIQADGVITLDLVALELLLDALGPTAVEGIEGPVTGANVLRVIQTQWANPSTGPSLEGSGSHEWWEHRKDFIGQIATAALDQLTTGQDVPVEKLVRALKEALDKKHVLVYLADPNAASLFHERNWGGAMPEASAPSDFLMVVDTNVGFNKVDPNVERAILYEVDLSIRDAPKARLTLTYRHLTARPVGACIQETRYNDSYEDMMERCYWDYVRIYTGAGSRLLAAPELPLPAGSVLALNGDTTQPPVIKPALSPGGHPVWGEFFDLAPMDKRRLVFEYMLPVRVLDSSTDGAVRYRLRVQKQPGTVAVPLLVEITLPPGAELVDTVPAIQLLPKMSSLELTTDLRLDREFEIVFREGKTGP